MTSGKISEEIKFVINTIKKTNKKYKKFNVHEPDLRNHNLNFIKN